MRLTTQKNTPIIIRKSWLRPVHIKGHDREQVMRETAEYRELFNLLRGKRPRRARIHPAAAR